MTKYIFVTGGVTSSVGKGITVASIGRLLKARGLTVQIQKLDPYLNIDPGTMSPLQHGEVWVTNDGAETDLDLGHYERFTGDALGRGSSITTGQIYLAVMEKERRGDFLGGTIQVVPHITNEIKLRIRAMAVNHPDVVIVEVGGTVGDIEGQPFLEAIRQMRKDVGRDSVLYIHVTLLPTIPPSSELKTKPTQHSVKELRHIGITPDLILLRTDRPVPEEIRQKVSLFCDVDLDGCMALETVESIYEIPLVLESNGLGEKIVQLLHLPARVPDLRDWRHLVERIRNPKHIVRVALVGKYHLTDAYLSVIESLTHGAIHHNCRVQIVWVPSDELEADPRTVSDRLANVAAVVVPGGFGDRGIEGKIAAVRYARENRLPYLGLCYGMQLAVVEFARNVCGLLNANSTEVNASTPHPVIDVMPSQLAVTTKGGTMRLGAYPCTLSEGSKAAKAYGTLHITERHRHRYEFNNAYRETMKLHGLALTGVSPDGQLVEVIELPSHPFFVATQFHPEFQSRPTLPHPLFRDFVGAALQSRHHEDAVVQVPVSNLQSPAYLSDSEDETKQIEMLNEMPLN